MAYGQLKYQFIGATKDTGCTCCNGKKFIDSHTVCPECHGSGTRASQIANAMTIKVCREETKQ